MSEEVICLSDSEESGRSATSDEPNVRHSDEEIDFNFPPVEFTYYVNESINVIDKKRNPVQTSDAITQPLNAERQESSDGLKKNGKYDKNKGPMDKSSEYIPPRKIVPQNDYITQSMRKERLENMRKGEEIRVATRFSHNEGKEKEKEATQSNRETRKEQVGKEKSLKALERKNLKKIQPTECLKFMQVRLDRGLENFGFHPRIVDALANSDISWESQTLPVVNSIMWMRETEEHYIDDSNELCTKTNRVTANQVIIVWNWDEAVRRVKEGNFVFAVKDTLNLVPGAQPTLILYGMEEYFRDNKKAGKQNSSKNTNNGCTSLSGLPKISKHDLEIYLTEIQIILNCNIQLIDAPEDLGSVVYRFTKSIAEIPYKLAKRQKLAEKLDWYATGDNRDTVRVDKSGNGLKRLWQQQLCQFNLASLETAEAISSVYPSPLQLMEAYQNCTSDEGEKLLKDIPIRRAAGPLSTVRKIGPELSKKIFIMFTSENGEALLGNEKEL